MRAFLIVDGKLTCPNCGPDTDACMVETGVTRFADIFLDDDGLLTFETYELRSDELDRRAFCCNECDEFFNLPEGIE